MKNIYTYILSFAVAIGLAAGCAKEVTSGPNEANERFMKAWMHVYNQTKGTDIEPSGLGIYILEETPGDGAEVTENGYAIVEYVKTDLDGNISEYTDALTAKQLGAYSPASYYGPKVWLTKDETIQAGLQNALVGMKVGGRKKVLVPSWLMTYSTYGSAAEYLKHSSDYANTIYDLTIKDFTESIDEWQIEAIKDYIGTPDTFTNDTTGFYFKREGTLPADAKEFSKDTSIYINYTGKLLGGLVFDTTSERTAKEQDIYDPAKTYGPVKINWSESAGGITMGSSSSSVISGFARTLWKMRYVPDSKYRDKCIGIFTSSFGYGYSGSGSSIPGYAPLIFEIEVVDKPED